MNNKSKIKLVNENGVEKTYGEIPDLWHLIQNIRNGQDHGAIGAKAAAELAGQIHQVWMMAHDLKAVVEKQKGSDPHHQASLVEVRGVGINRLAQLDDIVRRNTAFKNFFDLVDSHDNYRPTIDVSDPEMNWLAKAYDLFQERRGDDRRAFVVTTKRPEVGVDPLEDL